MKRVTGLGRGLSSLIPPKLTRPQVLQAAREEKYDFPEDRENIVLVPPRLIAPNPQQPRQEFAADRQKELEQSIAEHGILQPLIVTKTPGGYQLISGERRLRSAVNLGLKTVPVLVRTATDQQNLELSLIENIQRENLKLWEEAQAYQRLIEEFGLTQEAVAKRLGKPRSTVANILRLLQLPPAAFKALQTGQITPGHAKAILEIKEARKQLQLLQQIIQGKYSVRQAENQAQRIAHHEQSSKRVEPLILEQEENLRNYLATKVKITKRGKLGKITIDFYSVSELLALIKKIIK